MSKNRIVKHIYQLSLCSDFGLSNHHKNKPIELQRNDAAAIAANIARNAV